MGEPVTGLPETVQQKVRALGEEGARWLNDLPGVIAELRELWSITSVGPPLPGGTAAYVARVTVADGQDGVLKIALPGHESDDAAMTLAAAHGRGYVRLLAYDTHRQAMLQEALGPSLADLAFTPEQTITALCETLQRAWRTPLDPADLPRPDKAEQLGRLVRRLWAKLGQPCSGLR